MDGKQTLTAEEIMSHAIPVEEPERTKRKWKKREKKTTVQVTVCAVCRQRGGTLIRIPDVDPVSYVHKGYACIKRRQAIDEFMKRESVQQALT